MPTTYPSAKRVLGGAKEVTLGTAVTPITFTYPCDSFEPEDKPTWLQDKATRGDMGEDYGQIQGVMHSEFSGSGPFFNDVSGYLLSNILGDLVTTPGTPNSHVFSLLNSGTGQPGSLTLAQWQGLPLTTFVRLYPGSVLSELTIKGNTETGLVMLEFKGSGFPSQVAGGAVTFTPSAELALAAWRTAIGIGGPASGGTQNRTIREWSVTIAREVSVEHTAANTQSPYQMQRGVLKVTGELEFTKPSTEEALLWMLQNTQPQLQIVVSNGGVAAALRTLQIDIQQAAFSTSKINFGDPAVGYNATFTGILNTANAGASGGRSPIKVTLQNAIGSGVY